MFDGVAAETSTGRLRQEGSTRFRRGRCAAVTQAGG
jgi:hypothetical protein